MGKKMVSEKVIPNLWRVRHKQLSATGYFDCYTVVSALTLVEAFDFFNDNIADGYHFPPIDSGDIVKCVKPLTAYSYNEKTMVDKSKVILVLDELSASIKEAIEIFNFDYDLTNDIEKVDTGKPWLEVVPTGWKKLKLEIRWLAPVTQTIPEKGKEG